MADPNSEKHTLVVVFSKMSPQIKTSIVFYLGCTQTF